jgi:cobalt-zinc-cadmium efflux system protein
MSISNRAGAVVSSGAAKESIRLARKQIAQARRRGIGMSDDWRLPLLAIRRPPNIGAMSDELKPPVKITPKHAGHGHSHGGHSHGSGAHGSHAHQDHGHTVLGNIRFAFALNILFSLVELVGGYWIGSFAIMSGAVHDFGDAVSLAIAWGLERLANRGRDESFNYGYKRFSLLSAMISGLVIITGSVIIIYEAIEHFNPTEAPSGTSVIALALLGLAVNGFAAWRLSKGATQNERVLTWHQIEDMMGWAIVLIGGVVISLTHIAWVDSVLAIGLAVFVLFNVLKHLKNTGYLFLQGRPPGFSEGDFISDALAVSGVEHVDHLSVWSLDGETSILSARLHLHSVREPLEIERVKDDVRKAAARQGAKATLETCLAAQIPHSDEP